MCDYCDCRFRPLIAALGEDHARISTLSARLRARAEAGDRAGAAVVAADLAAVLDPHSRLEESGLYVELEAIGFDAADLHAEHLRVDEAVAAAAAGTADLPEVIDALDALTRHIRMEEYDLFPAAHQLLDHQAWDRLTS